MHFPAPTIRRGNGPGKKRPTRAQQRLLRDHLGKFVVIHHDEIAGIYDTPDDAIFEAYKRFGLVPLIVKEIRPEEPADFVSSVISTIRPSSGLTKLNQRARFGCTLARRASKALACAAG